VHDFTQESRCRNCWENRCEIARSHGLIYFGAKISYEHSRTMSTPGWPRGCQAMASSRAIGVALLMPNCPQCDQFLWGGCGRCAIVTADQRAIFFVHRRGSCPQ